MGNRLQKVDSSSGTENYTFNAANMLLTRGANSYTNDSDGNTLTGGGRTNTWDSQNRLAQCVFNGTTSTFTYASDGLRHREVSGGITRDFVLDSSMMVREKNSGGNLATYLIGARGPEYRRDDSTGTVRWYSYDGLGSVLGEVDPNGNLTASRSYDVYGSVRTSAGTSTSKHKFCGQLGHPSEDETGLVYMRARYMDPVTGRFMSEDPKIEGLNWFSYCMADPVNYSDESGQRRNWIRAEILAALGWACTCSAVMLAAGAGSSVNERVRDLGAVGAVALAELGIIFFAFSAVALDVSEDAVLASHVTAVVAVWVAESLIIISRSEDLPGGLVASTTAFLYGCVLIGYVMAIDM